MEGILISSLIGVVVSGLFAWRYKSVKYDLAIEKGKFEQAFDELQKKQAEMDMLRNEVHEQDSRLNRTLKDTTDELISAQSLLAQCADPEIVRFRLARISGLLSTLHDKVHPNTPQVLPDDPTPRITSVSGPGKK